MNKKIVKQLVSVILAVAMVFSMVITASAATTYHVTVEIKEANAPYREYSLKSPSIGLNDSLSGIVFTLLGRSVSDACRITYVADMLSTGFDPTKDYGLYQFESEEMMKLITSGTNAYNANQSDNTSWDSWSAGFMANDRIYNVAGVASTVQYGTNVGLKALLADLNTPVNALAENARYPIEFQPDPAAIPDNDRAENNTYTVTISWVTEGTPGPTPTYPSDHEIKVIAPETATVTTSATRAKANEQVTVSVVTDEGYVIDTITVKSHSGAEIVATGYGDGTYKFTMPAEAVTVTVTTKPAGGGHDDSSCPASKFEDVDLTEWYHEAIDFVCSNNMMVGCGEKTFKPDGPLTRAMVAQIFFNLEGRPGGKYPTPFPDVVEGQWHFDAVTWGYAHNVVAGYGDGLYRPDQIVTREELVQIFFNYTTKYKFWTERGYVADLNEYADGAEVAPWHAEAVSWGLGYNLMAGKGGKVIDPKADAVRAEAAQMLMNLCLNIGK